jgi:hypothetical protein
MLAEEVLRDKSEGQISLTLGLDPGRDKTGWALVLDRGELLLAGIVPTGDLNFFLAVFALPSLEWEESLKRWICERRSAVPDETRVERAALGNGTGSREAAEWLVRFGLKVLSVDEKGTTLAARDLYWSLHHPTLWQRCLPRSLRVPPRVVDDMAAWAIALRGVEMISAGG